MKHAPDGVRVCHMINPKPDLRVEVEELNLMDSRDYKATVRANSYENKLTSVGGAQKQEGETLAVFTVKVPRIPHGRQKAERKIEHISADARQEVLRLCKAIVAILDNKPKTGS